jgi:hypothetical protein
VADRSRFLFEKCSVPISSWTSPVLTQDIDGLLNPSRKMSRYFVDYTITASLQIVSISKIVLPFNRIQRC